MAAARERRPSDEHDAEERARTILLAEHPEVREQYELMRPRFEAASALIRARREAGLTQAQLAERMGRRQSLISAIESGRRSPRLETLADAARALDRDLRVEFAPREADAEGTATAGGGE
jgi:ribosome-binding protein aMBF1 (putative translation factor)